ncbi:hypothetical protein JY97_00115 [Alkalispirochaeta odontotermitis]|nr:hypothetical protein JY97_00115 [Alkalispirochaeta odontotermitis]CAB1081995.1 hypothetical protein D1AOALGA4SA_9635 [Olavius algarvensis Delta 1 endosymbiont]
MKIEYLWKSLRSTILIDRYPFYLRYPAPRNQIPEDRKQMSEDRETKFKSPYAESQCQMPITTAPQPATRTPRRLSAMSYQL